MPDVSFFSFLVYHSPEMCLWNSCKCVFSPYVQRDSAVHVTSTPPKQNTVSQTCSLEVCGPDGRCGHATPAEYNYPMHTCQRQSRPPTRAAPAWALPAHRHIPPGPPGSPEQLKAYVMDNKHVDRILLCLNKGLQTMAQHLLSLAKCW